MVITTQILLVLDPSILPEAKAHWIYITCLERIIHKAYVLIKKTSQSLLTVRKGVPYYVCVFSLAKPEYAGFNCRSNCFEIVYFSLL